MKKSYVLLTALSCCFISQINAQTLTAAGINPTIGETMGLFSTAGFNEGNAGSGQTWDISSLTGTPSGVTIVTPGSTPSGSSFPTSNAVFEQGGAYTYLKTSASALQNVGISGGGVNIVYSNGEDLLHFPLALTNTYMDSWAASFVSGGYTFYRTGTTTVTADGTGTLITPDGTISNVVRIHFVQDYQDSTFIGVPYLINYVNDQYFWYKDGVHYALASTFHLTSDTGADNTGGYYQSLILGVNENSQLADGFAVYPNPATDKIQVQFSNDGASSVRISLINLAGQEVYARDADQLSTGENIQTIAVDGLEKGTYFVRIASADAVATQKITIN